MKRITYLLLMTLIFALASGCSNKNKKTTTARSTQPYYTGSQYGQQFYNNCGQQQQQYYNPYNQQPMNCQYQNGYPSFTNPYGQQYPTDYYGNPCMTMQVDPYSGYCMDYSYYPMYW